MTDGKVRVSRYYPPGKEGTWQHNHATWAFEFPLRDLESAAPVTYCVCERRDGHGFVHCLRVPHQYVLDHRNALYERIDKSHKLSIGVFLAADSTLLLRDLRGSGRVEFQQFLLPS